MGLEAGCHIPFLHGSGAHVLTQAYPPGNDHISPPKGTFEDDANFFSFPKGGICMDMLVPYRVSLDICLPD